MTARTAVAGPTIAVATLTTRGTVAGGRSFAGRTEIAELTAQLVVEGILEAHCNGAAVGGAVAVAATRAAIISVTTITTITTVRARCTLAAALGGLATFA